MKLNLFTRTKEAKSNSSFTLSGPIVFMTFTANTFLSSQFKISFAAVETGRPPYENFDDYKFTHYHFRDLSGSFSYPELKGNSHNLWDEVVTYTISTIENHTVYLDALDLENNSLCQYESFDRFYYNYESKDFTQAGPEAQGFR